MPFSGTKKSNVELISIRRRSPQELADDISVDTSRRKSSFAVSNQGYRINQLFNSTQKEEEKTSTAPRKVIINSPQRGLEPGNHHVSEARLVEVRKSLTGRCGFRLTRTVHDPYPWVCINQVF